MMMNLFHHHHFPPRNAQIPSENTFLEVNTCFQIIKSVFFLSISTGERPFIDILQDRRYWVIHLITIPSLFLAGGIFIFSGFVSKLFGVANFNQYFYNDHDQRQISIINDRFSILNEIEDV